MLPPWLALPWVAQGSIGWRMGVGEAYLIDLRTWWSRQPCEARMHFRSKYPEPEDWAGFYTSL
jgi:hypothetical protein